MRTFITLAIGIGSGFLLSKVVRNLRYQADLAHLNAQYNAGIADAQNPGPDHNAVQADAAAAARGRVELTSAWNLIYGAFG